MFEKKREKVVNRLTKEGMNAGIANCKTWCRNHPFTCMFVGMIFGLLANKRPQTIVIVNESRPIIGGKGL